MAVLKKLPYRPMVIVLMVFGLVFPFLFRYKYQQANRAMDYFDDGVEIELQGTLYKKEKSSQGCRLYLTNLSVSNTSFPGRAILLYESNEIPLNSKLHIKGYVSSFSVAENEGSFDEKKYMLSQGIFLKVTVKQVLNCKRMWSSVFFDYLYFLRQNVEEVYQHLLPGEESGLLSAMTLGDKTVLDKDVKLLFSKAGIAHLLAVSGLHISIVGMGVFRLLRRKFGFAVSGGISAFVVVCYGFFTGMSVSTLRALLMFFVLMLGQIIGKKYDMLSAWCLAFIIILIWEPLSMLNSGFLFSFGAVLGVVLVANPMVEKYECLCKARFEKTLRYRQGKNYRKSWKEKTVSTVLFALGIQLFTLPVVAATSYRIPSYVIFLNFIFIPLLGVVIGCGLVGGLLGSFLCGLPESMLSGLNSFYGGILGENLPFDIVIKMILFPCHLILYIYEWLSNYCLKFPGALVVTGHISVWKFILYYGLLLFFIWKTVAQRFWKKPVPRLRNEVYQKLWEGVYQIFAKNMGTSGKMSPIKRYLLQLLILYLGMILFTGIHPGKNFEVDMLSVGQGDDICIFSKEGEVFMLDGGSSTKTDVGQYVLEPFLLYHGVDKVDYWMLSHMDMDHISGCLELLEDGFPVKYLVLPETVKTEEDEVAKLHYERLLSLCRKNHTEVRYVSKGDSVQSPSLSFYVLAPKIPSSFSGTNENSMVVKLSYGDFDVVFTGDIGSEQEEWLLEEFGNNRMLQEIEVLKSAHHGSKNSNCDTWLSVLSPQLCIISAGKNNMYGHPSPETIDRLDAEEIPHMCTIDCGQIRILPKEDGKFEVETINLQ